VSSVFPGDFTPSAEINFTFLALYVILRKVYVNTLASFGLGIGTQHVFTFRTLEDVIIVFESIELYIKIPLVYISRL